MWLVVFLFIATPLGMLMAVLLDQSIRGSRIYQSVLYMPVVLSLAIVGFIWGNLMYSPGQGFINNFLATVSGDPKWVTPGTAIDWIGTRGSTSRRCSWPRAGATSATSWCCTWPG